MSVGDVCRTLAALMRPLADKKHVHLEAKIAEDLPIVVTDAAKLQQIRHMTWQENRKRNKDKVGEKFQKEFKTNIFLSEAESAFQSR